MDNSLIIRSADANDTAAIVNLFEVCLGAEGGAPTTDYWKWKHVDNPFGESPLLLAFYGKKLAGLRAFMPWRWQYQQAQYASFRAVDTATHPDYRGSGIFTLLTEQLWRQVQQQFPSSFIYNTPNEQSKPGYLKMGWQVLGKPHAQMYFVPFGNYERKKRIAAGELALSQFDFSAINISIENDAIEKIHTLVSAEYWKWRYLSIPDRSYAAWTYANGKGFACLMIFYLRPRKYFTELRVCECITLQGENTAEKMQYAFQQLAKQFAGSVVTTLSDTPGKGSSLMTKFIPEVTLRLPDSGNVLPAALTDISNWHFDMGTLELF